jgi:hypothetical protein
MIQSINFMLTFHDFKKEVYEWYIYLKNSGYDVMLLAIGLSGYLIKHRNTKKNKWRKLLDATSGGVTAMFMTPAFVYLFKIQEISILCGLAYIIGRMGDKIPDLVEKYILNKAKDEIEE